MAELVFEKISFGTDSLRGKEVHLQANSFDFLLQSSKPKEIDDGLYRWTFETAELRHLLESKGINESFAIEYYNSIRHSVQIPLREIARVAFHKKHANRSEETVRRATRLYLGKASLASTTAYEEYVGLFTALNESPDTSSLLTGRLDMAHKSKDDLVNFMSSRRSKLISLERFNDVLVRNILELHPDIIAWALVLDLEADFQQFVALSKLLILLSAETDTKQVWFESQSDFVGKTPGPMETVEARIYSALHGAWMSGLPESQREYAEKRYRALLHGIADGGTTYSKGLRLEKLIATAIKASNGLNLLYRRWRGHHEELDIIVANNIEGTIGAEIGASHIFFECKNQDAPSGPHELAWFEKKLRRRAVGKIGVFVSVAGFTKGFFQDLEINRGDEVIIVPLDLSDLQRLFSKPSDTLINVLVEKIRIWR